MNAQIDKNWNRWILSSVYDHFKKGVAPRKILFESEDPIVKPNDPKDDNLIFKHLGPDFNYSTTNDCTMMITMNVMVVTYMDQKEPFRHALNVGLVQSLFPSCLSIFKYGPYKDVDDSTMLESMNLIGPVRCTPFGTFDSVTRVLRTTVEATYSATFEGD